MVKGSPKGLTPLTFRFTLVCARVGPTDILFYNINDLRQENKASYLGFVNVH